MIQKIEFILDHINLETFQKASPSKIDCLNPIFLKDWIIFKKQLNHDILNRIIKIQEHISNEYHFLLCPNSFSVSHNNIHLSWSFKEHFLTIEESYDNLDFSWFYKNTCNSFYCGNDFNENYSLDFSNIIENFELPNESFINYINKLYDIILYNKKITENEIIKLLKVRTLND